MSFSQNNSNIRSLIIVAFVSSSAFSQITDFDFTLEDVALPKDFGPTCVDLHDIDGDGHLDAVVSGRNLEGRVAVLSGTPDGSLVFDRELIGFGQTDWVEIADLNDDGNVEIVMAIRSSEGGVQIFDGLPGGGFEETPRRFEAGRECRCLRVVDIDLDGDLDILSLGHYSEDLRVLSGDGTGHFEASSRLRIAPWRNGFTFPQSFTIKDLNEDGSLDLATISLGTSRLHLNENVDGRFVSPTRSWKPPTINNGYQGGCAYGAWGDFDGDGRLSCVLPQTSFGLQWFALFEIDNSGSVVEKTIHSGSTQGLSWYPAVGDFDGDGDPDIAIGHALPGLVVFLENDTQVEADEDFLYPQTSFGFGFVRQLVVSDLEDDGDQDLVVVDFILNKLVLMRNALIGGFSGASSMPSTPVISVFDEALVPPDTSLVKWLSDLMPAEARGLFETQPKKPAVSLDGTDLP